MTGSLQVAVPFVCKEANDGGVVSCRHFFLFAELMPCKMTNPHYILFAGHYNTCEAGNSEMRYFPAASTQKPDFHPTVSRNYEATLLKP